MGDQGGLVIAQPCRTEELEGGGGGELQKATRFKEGPDVFWPGLVFPWMPNSCVETPQTRRK